MKMAMQPPVLILASRSPRRKELLSLAGIPFSTLPVDTSEVFDPEKSIEKNVEEIALKKADAAWNTIPEKHERTVVIGADTIVALDGNVLGKPAGYSDAFRMLKVLQDRSHKVHTGFALRYPTGTYSECVTTSVVFEAMSDEEIRHYLDCAMPFDKAGSYGIQDPVMACYVRGIEGCYYNVVGLPLSRLCMALKRCIPEAF